MSDKSFLKFIAYLQIIGIILVVFGHSFHEYPDGSEGKLLLAYRMPFSFRMPLFVFVSGFLLYYTTFYRNRSIPFFKFLFNKFKRLLIPYFTLGIVTFLPRAVMSSMADDNIPLTSDEFLLSLFHSDHLVIPFFWFLQLSFLLLVVTYSFLLLSGRLRLRHDVCLYLLVALSIFLPFLPIDYSGVWAAFQIPKLSLYFFLGTLYCLKHREVDRWIPWEDFRFLGMGIICWALLFFLTEDTIFSPLCSLAGIMMCISVAKLLEKYDATFLDHLVGANYMIFLLSWYFNVASQQVLHHFTDFPWWVYSILSLSFGIYVPWLFYRIMLRHPHHPIVKTFSFLLGQSLKNKR